MKRSEVGGKFNRDVLTRLLPADKSDQFFEALFGDVEEGAYDISLSYNGIENNRLEFLFNLKRRPRKCLTCSLTYGLPGVFERHPVIGVNAIVHAVERILGEGYKCPEWKLGRTREISPDLHAIPLSIQVVSTDNN